MREVWCMRDGRDGRKNGDEKWTFGIGLRGVS